MRITIKKLRALEACADQVEIFAREWPNGCRITKRNVLRMAALDLDVAWLARRVLRDLARAEYEKIRNPAWAEYKKICAIAFWKLVK